MREVLEEAGLIIAAKPLGKGFLLMDRCKNPEYLFFGFEFVSSTSPTNFPSHPEFPVVRIPRLEFSKQLIKGQFAQLGALSIISLIDYCFDVRFLSDPYSKLLEKGLFK